MKIQCTYTVQELYQFLHHDVKGVQPYATVKIDSQGQGGGPILGFSNLPYQITIRGVDLIRGLELGQKLTLTLESGS